MKGTIHAKVERKKLAQTILMAKKFRLRLTVPSFKDAVEISYANLQTFNHSKGRAYLRTVFQVTLFGKQAAILSKKIFLDETQLSVAICLECSISNKFNL